MSFFTNKNGNSLVSILVAVVIIAALIYGGLFFWNKSDNNISTPGEAVKVLDQAKDDVAEIQENIDERKKELVEQGEEIIDEGIEIIKSEKANNDPEKYAITINNIKPGDNLLSPVTITGEAVAFENTVIIELRNKEHETMVREFANVKSPDIGKKGPYKITLHFEFQSTKEGFIAVYEESAKDGSRMNLIEIPVTFNTIENNNQ